MPLTTVAALEPPPIITPFSPNSLGAALITSGVVLGSATSGAWVAANTALFYPFSLARSVTVFQLLFWVGATSSGNIDVGIYDALKNRIVSAGSTAMSATVNTVQELNITDTPLGPGDYLLAAACDNTTGTVFRASGADETMLPAHPIYEQAGLTAAALTNPAVPVVSTLASPPVVCCGIQCRSVF